MVALHTLSLSYYDQYPSKALLIPQMEYMAYCPGCKAVQTVTFIGEKMITTRKFAQFGDRIYHDCGHPEPCKMFSSTGILGGLKWG